MPSPSSSTAAASFQATLDLFQTGMDLMRRNLRRRFPDASDEAIEQRLGQWLRDRPGDAASSDRSGSQTRREPSSL